MSRNALALVDCSSREQLYQFLIEQFDRRATKNEMISPYDDQLIGKMNFRYGGMEHAMFFTYPVLRNIRVCGFIIIKLFISV